MQTGLYIDTSLIIHDHFYIYSIIKQTQKQSKLMHLSCKSMYFRWLQWGSSLPGLRTLDPPLSNPSTPAEIFGTHVCKVTFNHLPRSLTSHIQSFRTLGQILNFSLKKLKNIIFSKRNFKKPKNAPRGARGGLQISPFFVRINPM